MYFKYANGSSSEVKPDSLVRMYNWPNTAQGDSLYDDQNALWIRVYQGEMTTLGGSYMKVGPNSGYRTGNNAISCAHTRDPVDPDIWFACQQYLIAEQLGGDSGAPVFSRLNDNDVQMHGVAWGRLQVGSTVYTIWSDVYNITTELGW